MTTQEGLLGQMWNESPPEPGSFLIALLRYSFNITKFTLYQYTICPLFFCNFTKWCNHHHKSTLEHALHPLVGPSLMPIYRTSCPHSSPRQPPIYLVSLLICPFWAFHTNGITHCVVPCVWFQQYHSISESHPYGSPCDSHLLLCAAE